MLVALLVASPIRLEDDFRFKIRSWNEGTIFSLVTTSAGRLRWFMDDTRVFQRTVDFEYPLYVSAILGDSHCAIADIQWNHW